MLHALTIDVNHSGDPLAAAAERAAEAELSAEAEAANGTASEAGTAPDPADDELDASASQAAPFLTSLSSSMRLSRFSTKLKARRDASASVFELDGRLTHAPLLRPTDPLRYQVSARSRICRYPAVRVCCALQRALALFSQT